MNITIRATVFVIAAALMTILAGFLCVTPANAAISVKLPGENLAAPVQDNPAVTNNGEGRDADDMAELKEQWRKPEYASDERRQMAGMVVIVGAAAGFGVVTRKIASAK
jgi:hypothetical protein